MLLITHDPINNQMPSKNKKTTSIQVIIAALCLILTATSNINAAREITSFHIARWYLDSDLVLICHANKIDTILINHHDSLTNHQSRITYDLVKEAYSITVDSVIKSTSRPQKKIRRIYSQKFPINYSNVSAQPEKNPIYRVNNIGDTVGVDTIYILNCCGINFWDSSYYRIDKSEKYLVILSSTPNGYIIDYASTISSDYPLDLIKKVKELGESYFDIYWKPPPPVSDDKME